MSSCPSTVLPQPTTTTNVQTVQPTTRPGPGDGTTPPPTDFVSTVDITGSGGTNLGLIVGIAVTVVLITIVVVLAIVLLIYIMVKRSNLRSKRNGLVNPSYDLSKR